MHDTLLLHGFSSLMLEQDCIPMLPYLPCLDMQVGKVGIAMTYIVLIADAGARKRR